jgi:hypothetical protein
MKMNYRNLQPRLAAAVLYVAALSTNLFVPTRAAAQPPPQGPPAATLNAQSVPADLLNGVLMSTIDTQVAAENAILAADPNHRAVISASSQRLTPFMMYTTDPDKPNQFYAEIPVTVTYHVTDIKAKVLGTWISYPFDRTITQYVSLQATCEGWYTGSGKLTYTAVVSPAYLEGDHSFAEEAIGAILLELIPNFVDHAIADAIKNVPSGTISIGSGVACRTLGVATKPQGFPFDSVEYDPPTGLHSPIKTSLNQITVRITQIKRLPLHTLAGGAVYDVIEAPFLDFYAGYSHTLIPFPQMAEGQVVVAPPQANTVQTGVPSSSSLLVLIGAISYGGVIQENDSAFVTFGSSSSFGSGTHTFQVMKHWVEPSPIPGSKPLARSGPAYEITVEISSPATQITHVTTR